MLRRAWLRAPLLACATLALALGAGDAHADKDATKRWKVWRKDLDHLCEVIEKESSLKQIFKAKGIDWKTVRKEATKRFKDLSAAAKKRKKADRRADEIAFLGVLRYVVSQLRDSHAYVSAGKEIDQAWWDARPPRYDAGIELQPGTYGTIVVANTWPARKSTSPLRGRGVNHEATILESVDGVPAAEYFDELARKKHEEDGWQSTRGRALSDAFNGLQLEEKGKLELVFKTLDASEKARRGYLKLPPAKRIKAFARFKWKRKKVSLNASECKGVRNPRNFRCMHLPRLELTKTAAPSVWYCRLPSGMGYVVYYEVKRDSRDGLTEACKALADCKGLILDLRWNGGGGDGNVAMFDKGQGAWSKPLAVVMGPRTFSAAETEIWELQRMRTNHRCDARFFGRTTAGASGDKIAFELPSGFAKGRFVYRHWRGGRSKIEGAGLEPDEVVHQDVVELSLGVDSCIRRAEQWLAEQ
jgi:hypothetical protein